MNLHEITTQGSGISLGPCTVTKAFPKFAGSSSVLVLVSDASVQSPVALKVWGPASNTAFAEGMVVMIQGQGPKGKIEYKEYKGKWELNCNDTSIIVDRNGAPPQHAPQTAPQSSPAASGGYEQRPQAASGHDKLPDVAKRCATFTRLYIDEMVVNHGFSKEEAIQLAQNAPSWYPLFWFGEKGLN